MRLYLVPAVLAIVIIQANAQRFFGPQPQRFQPQQQQQFRPQQSFQQQNFQQPQRFQQQQSFQQPPQQQFRPQQQNFNNFDLNSNQKFNNFNNNNGFNNNNFNNNNQITNAPVQTQTQKEYEFGLDTSDGRYVKFDGPVRGIPEGHGGGKYGAADCLLC